MSLNIQETHRNSILSMLSLESYDFKTRKNPIAQDLWKVLIYDTACQDILSPLIKIGSLRQHGVTLNLLLNVKRSAVSNVPAVYFVEPTKENLDRIVEDIKKNFYKCYYLNFSKSISESLLEDFANNVSQTMMAHRVGSVIERLNHFVSLSSFEFLLNIPNVFSLVHSVDSSLHQIEECLERLCDGLLCVIVTLGVIPVLRYPTSSNSPSRILGEKLHKRLKGLLASRETSQLFSRVGSTFLERPLLVLTDREIDLNVMLHHTWTYQSLVHDLFELRLNRVIIPLTTTTSENDKRKHFDLDSSDTLWKEYGPRSFVDAAVSISEAFQDYCARKNDLDQGSNKNKSDQFGVASSTAGVQSALETLNAIPEMVAKKKSIDMHTNIAHAIVDEITSRGLDKLYETEDNLETGTIQSGLAQLERLVNASEKGTVEDKKRAILCFYTSRRGQLTPENMKQLKEIMNLLDSKSRALDFLKRLESFKSLERMDLSSVSQTGTTSNPLASNWGANLFDRSKDLLQGVRKLLPRQKFYPIERTVNDLMTNKQGSLFDQEYSYVDPKVAEQFINVDDKSVPRFKSNFKQAVVFILGGGSYVESQTLKETATRNGKQIIYGTTDFVTPQKFLQELEYLGQRL